MIELMIDYGLRLIGTPYRYGGNTPLLGIDCSGLICEMLRVTGIVRHHEDLNAQGLFARLQSLGAVVQGFEQTRRGDIIFFGKNRESISHVAMALGQGVMLEAGGGDSTTHTVQDADRAYAFVRIRPITNRKDPVAGCRVYP